MGVYECCFSSWVRVCMEFGLLMSMWCIICNAGGWYNICG